MLRTNCAHAVVAVALIVRSASAAHSFFSVPVPFQPASVERLTMRQEHFYEKDRTEKWRDISVTFFAGHSTDSDKLARYFLPFDKTSLVAGGLGSSAVQDGSADVIAHYFNVLNGLPRSAASGTENDIFPVINTWTFQSNLAFKPTHQYMGLGFLFHQHLSHDLDRGWWLNLALPIMGVKNTMGMRENVIVPPSNCSCGKNKLPSFFSDTENAKSNMTEGFASYKFKFGRIDAQEEKKTKWGVADFEAGLGYTFVREHEYHLHGYAGILLPTGNTPGAEYVFEKVIGHNGHFGYFFNAFGGIKTWEHDDNFLAIELNGALTFFADKIQVRSIDPYGKPWGRYIWAYPNGAPTTQLLPGIDFFTQAVNVSHGMIGDFNVAAVYDTGHFQGELGYHVYARDKERVSLARECQCLPGLGAIWYSNNNFLKTGDERVSRNGATINNYSIAMNDVKEFKATSTPDEQRRNDAFKVVRTDMLDLESAAHPAILVNTIYASLGYAWPHVLYPVSINAAGAYEFGRGNAVMDGWRVWAKLGLAF